MAIELPEPEFDDASDAAAEPDLRVARRVGPHHATEHRRSQKSHASLSPHVNALLIGVWAAAVVSAFLIVHPGLPLTIALAGGLLGAVAGVLPHLSIRQASDGFLTASSLMEVRRAFTSNPWGRKYIGWLYFSKASS